jgi:deazaflavin-dependent oxidoreductase (nitroreductase family)
VLETVGRKSGERRSTPAVYVREGDAFAVVAAAGGTRTPAWWLNLQASGEGIVVLDGRRTPVRPRVPEGEERARLWQRYLTVYPAAAEYVRMAGREFPLIVLEPV